MSATSEKARAEFALEIDRQRRQLLQQAQGGAFGVVQLMVLIWPLLLLGIAILKKDLSSAEQLIAQAAALGLLFLYIAVQLDANRRTRALLRLIDRKEESTPTS